MSSPQMHALAAYLRLTRSRRTAPDATAAAREIVRTVAG